MDVGSVFHVIETDTELQWKGGGKKILSTKLRLEKLGLILGGLGLRLIKLNVLIVMNQTQIV